MLDVLFARKLHPPGLPKLNYGGEVADQLDIAPAASVAFVSLDRLVKERESLCRSLRALALGSLLPASCPVARALGQALNQVIEQELLPPPMAVDNPSAASAAAFFHAETQVLRLASLERLVRPWTANRGWALLNVLYDSDLVGVGESLGAIGSWGRDFNSLAVAGRRASRRFLLAVREPPDDDCVLDFLPSQSKAMLLESLDMLKCCGKEAEGKEGGEQTAELSEDDAEEDDEGSLEICIVERHERLAEFLLRGSWESLAGWVRALCFCLDFWASSTGVRRVLRASSHYVVENRLEDLNYKLDRALAQSDPRAPGSIKFQHGQDESVVVFLPLAPSRHAAAARYLFPESAIGVYQQCSARLLLMVRAVLCAESFWTQRRRQRPPRGHRPASSVEVWRTLVLLRSMLDLMFSRMCVAHGALELAVASGSSDGDAAPSSARQRLVGLQAAVAEHRRRMGQLAFLSSGVGAALDSLCCAVLAIESREWTGTGPPPDPPHSCVVDIQASKALCAAALLNDRNPGPWAQQMLGCFEQRDFAWTLQ